MFALLKQSDARFFRLEEDTLRPWPDFPSFPPILRIRYTSPPMVLQCSTINPDRVRRADRENLLQCSDSQEAVPAGDVAALIASCQNKMEGLGRAIKMFQDKSRGGHSPAGWAMMVLEYFTDTTVLTCPGLDEGDYPDCNVSYEMLFPTLSERDLRELAEEWGMAPTNLTELKTQVSAVIETHKCADGNSRNVLHWDGHTERLDAARWQAEIVPYLPMADAFRRGNLRDPVGRESVGPR